MTIDATPAEADEITQGEVMHEVGCFMDEKTASHIADLHNRWLVDSRADVDHVGKIWPPSSEFAQAEEKTNYPKFASSMLILGSFGRNDVRFDQLNDEGPLLGWKATHISTGRTGTGRSQVSAMMNLAETWDGQTE